MSDNVHTGQRANWAQAIIDRYIARHNPAPDPPEVQRSHTHDPSVLSDHAVPDDRSEK